MVTLRCTQKLLRRVGVPAEVGTNPPTTVLGDWYATLVLVRPQQLVLCMNERTLLVVLVPARESKSLPERIRDAVAAQLRRLGVPSAAVETEARTMSKFAFGRTASRRLLGCLGEAEYALSLEFERPRFSSLADLEDYFSTRIYSTTRYRHPNRVALELFAAAGAAVDDPVAARIH